MIRNSKRGQVIVNEYEYDASFFCIDLTMYVKDSKIKNVYFSKAVINAIYDFTLLEINTKHDSNLDEIGGFLLGKYLRTPENVFDIGIEIFCAAEEGVEKSPSNLVIGVEANIVLANLMDNFPDLCLLGWFHTHPGYTPYLSKIDLECNHNLFYVQPFQVAIVLDPLTNRFDTGIFSRKTNDSMNNNTDYSEWINWKDLIFLNN